MTCRQRNDTARESPDFKQIAAERRRAQVCALSPRRILRVAVDDQEEKTTSGASSPSAYFPSRSISMTPESEVESVLGGPESSDGGSSSADVSKQERLHESPVQLAIYDLNKDGMISVYHTGVIVFNEEWSYAGDLSVMNRPDGAEKECSGVFSVRPGSAMRHLKTVIDIGHVAMSEQQRQQLFQTIQTEWPITNYNLLKCNCNHFTHHLLSKELVRFCVVPGSDANTTGTVAGTGIGMGERPTSATDPKWTKRFRVPKWVNKTARIGQMVVPDFAHQTVHKQILKRVFPPRSRAAETAPPHSFDDVFDIGLGF